ncbi:type II secretion system F family protein [Streptomyces sp. G44]|uniref:type II secretion system F family protein n=1 Tax=Streptomyces sp. G44 TaxID=2807632 RepID=UPI0019618183|nr:type II secretion system F family protein [Streptomyces sp. G44]MBM7168473.1 type II secretion system F family protein [Streptomyces sp. G44]
MSSVHRVGVAVWSVTAVLWLALTVWAARRERALRRRAAEALGVAGPAVRRRELGRDRRPGLRGGGMGRTWFVVAGAVSLAYAVVGGAWGIAVGVAAGYCAWRQERTRASPRAQAGADDCSAEAERQLPLAADLLAACVAAGASPVAAARAVGESLRGPVGERLARGAAEVRLGGEPAYAWREVAVIPGAAPLARLLERAGESGAPTAEPVARLAEDARAARSRTAMAKARRAGVLMTAPVGLCFLPAFIAVGVAPVVIGLAEGLLRAE